MPEKICSNGHIYDPKQYRECPYCKNTTNTIDFDDDQFNKTVAPDMTPKKADIEPDTGNRTVGAFQNAHQVEPVVGWIVCIKGAEQGKDYHIYARINTIGRREDMDICLSHDMTVSMTNTHARIAYDPRHNSFQLIPGESINNIYLNDEPVYIPTKLAAYDRIEIGESTFSFVPFCGERFTWAEVIE